MIHAHDNSQANHRTSKRNARTCWPILPAAILCVSQASAQHIGEPQQDDVVASIWWDIGCDSVPDGSVSDAPTRTTSTIHLMGPGESCNDVNGAQTTVVCTVEHDARSLLDTCYVADLGENKQRTAPEEVPGEERIMAWTLERVDEETIRVVREERSDCVRVLVRQRGASD